MLRPLTLFLAVLTLPACSILTGKEDPRLLHGQHPLVDRIWDVEAERFISRDEFLAAVAESRYLMLGETHDNPLHHQHQAEIIAQLQKRSAVIVFEMIDDSQAQLIADNQPGTVDDLIDTLNQVSTGWRYDPLYKPVFESAQKAGYAILPGSLPREVIMGIMRDDGPDIPQPIHELMESTPLDAEQRASLEQEIEQAHCGMLHEGMADGMIQAQRAKDATMATRMAAQQDVGVRVLVAGAGHTRKDRGVPLYLASEVTGMQLLSISWMEVLPGKTTASAYSDYWSTGRLPFDYVWFTPRIERDDPCAAMRAHFRKSG